MRSAHRNGERAASRQPMATVQICDRPSGEAVDRLATGSVISDVPVTFPAGVLCFPRPAFSKAGLFCVQTLLTDSPLVR